MPLLPPSVLAHAPVGIGLSALAALFWAFSPLCFASAGRRIGSFPVVVLRVLLAAALLLLILPLYRAFSSTPIIWPTRPQLFLLAASGLAGMAIGDALFYEALIRLGPRRATQLQVLAPVCTVVIGWITLSESLPLQSVGGIALILAATSYAVLRRQTQNPDAPRDPGHLCASGIALSVAAAVFVGIGAVLGREAFRLSPHPDTFAATTIRVSATAFFLGIVPLLRGQFIQTLAHLRSPFILSRIIPGTLAGPFAGMLCYIAALEQLEAGIVSTLTAMSPIFILPMLAFRYRARITRDIILASLLATAGVALLCL